MLSSPSHVLSVGVVLLFDISVMALWGSLVVICHCAVSPLSLSWPRRVCAGAGCSSLLVHGGGPRCCSLVVVVGPHCRLCGRWALIIVCVTALSVHRRHLLWCPWWPLSTWHLDSKQWGVEVVFYSLGWPKTTRRCSSHHVDLASTHLVGDMCCEVVVVLQCAVVIVGGRRALWAVVAMGECGDVVLVGIIDGGG